MDSECQEKKLKIVFEIMDKKLNYFILEILSEKPKKISEIRKSIQILLRKKISNSTLKIQLNELENHNMIRRKNRVKKRISVNYEITEDGQNIYKIIYEMRGWIRNNL